MRGSSMNAQILRNKLEAAIRRKGPVVLSWQSVADLIVAFGQPCEVCGYPLVPHIEQVGGFIPCEYCSMKRYIAEQHECKTECQPPTSEGE
jgi:hypothetical protein